MKRLVLFFGFLFGAMVANGQMLDPVKWSYAAKKTSASEATVFIRAVIDKGWHIYSTAQAEGGPSKTSFSFVADKGYELLGKVVESKPISKFEKVFDMKVMYFDGSAIFSQKIRLKAGQVAVKGSVEYMACNDHECLPPTSVEFSIPVK